MKKTLKELNNEFWSPYKLALILSMFSSQQVQIRYNPFPRDTQLSVIHIHDLPYSIFKLFPMTVVFSYFNIFYKISFGNATSIKQAQVLHHQLWKY